MENTKKTTRRKRKSSKKAAAPKKRSATKRQSRGRRKKVSDDVRDSCVSISELEAAKFEALESRMLGFLKDAKLTDLKILKSERNLEKNVQQLRTAHDDNIRAILEEKSQHQNSWKASKIEYDNLVRELAERYDIPVNKLVIDTVARTIRNEEKDL